MMNKIYAFDFDGTLCTNKFPEIGEPIAETIELAKKVKSRGNYIILNTMRKKGNLEEAVKWCKEQGIVFDAVNDNLPHMKEFFKNNPRKIFANYYIDDHNMFVDVINGENPNCKTLGEKMKGLDKEMIENIFYHSICRYGKEPQCRQVMEECAELIQAVNKMLRYEDRPAEPEYYANLVEEIADVEIMLHQLKVMFNVSDDEVFKVKIQKAKREKERLEKLNDSTRNV